MSVYDFLFDVDSRLLRMAIFLYLDEKIIQQIQEAVEQTSKLQGELWQEELTNHLTEKVLSDLRVQLNIIEEKVDV